jgi:hypothetical protein
MPSRSSVVLRTWLQADILGDLSLVPGFNGLNISCEVVVLLDIREEEAAALNALQKAGKLQLMSV